MTHLPRWNSITPNKSVHLPRRWAFFDTETSEAQIDGERAEMTLRLGAACYVRLKRAGRAGREEWLDFTERDKILDWLTAHTAKSETLYVVAHNLPFDLLVLRAFSGLAARGWRMSRVYHKFTTTIVRFANGGRRICFLDTMNYYPSKLAELGEHVGLHKQAMPPFSADDATWLDYCRGDVAIVKEAMLRLIQTLYKRDLGSFKSTGPGLAFNIWRHKYMSHQVRPHHLPGVVKLERQAYVGGFTMPFRLRVQGEGRLYKLDVNSMYPAVMRQHAYPTQLVRREGSMTPKELGQWLKTHLAIARVSLVVSRPRYPVRREGHTLYPVGTFETVLCTRSLLSAIRRNELARVSWVLLYEPGRIFTKFVSGLYSSRTSALRRGDRAAALFWKMCLNGLYGKFGQRASESKMLGECDPALFYSEQEWHAPTGQWLTMTYAGGRVTMARDGGETRNSFPAIAAHVTEDARMKLFALIEKAGPENVLYSDTDSLVVTAAGRRRLSKFIHPSRLGYLKVEDEGDDWHCWGKKDYAFGGKRRLKGFKHATGEWAFQTEEQEQITGFTGALARLHTETVQVQMRHRAHDPYLVNVRLDSDLRVRPLRLPEDAERIGQVVYLREVMGA